ncbi:MAG: hypothetical protein WAK60_04945 [Sedimentisphaerales bacterium]
MTPAEKFLVTVQVISSFIIALTLIVYFLQLRTMRQQLNSSHEATTAQSILALMNFLQDDKVRAARATVIKSLSRKKMEDWSEEEKNAASKVCSTYDIAAILIKMGLVPSKPFVENWGPSIKKCYKVLEPFISEMQKPENAGPDYWNDFGDLYKHTK